MNRLFDNHHVIAAVHMLDAYDYGVEWDCPCESCQEVRSFSELATAMQKALREQPPKPDRKQVPIHVVEVK